MNGNPRERLFAEAAASSAPGEGAKAA
jgi:hypothetical protein